MLKYTVWNHVCVYSSFFGYELAPSLPKPYGLIICACYHAELVSIEVHMMIKPSFDNQNHHFQHPKLLLE